MCFDDDARPPIPVSEGTGAQGQDVSLTAADGTRVLGYLAEPGGTPSSQVLILPDVRGLHTFYRELAMRFAEIGIRALAIDYFGRTAQTNDRTDAFEYMPHVQQMTQENFGQDLTAGVEYLRQDASQDLATFTVGFCMGGSLSLWAGTRGLDLAGVIGFYAGLSGRRGAVTPVLEWAREIQSPVLGLFGGADKGIPVEQVEQLDKELDEAGIDHEIVIYPGAPHSFFDRRAQDYAEVSADAWTRIQGFIAGHQLVRA